MQYSILVVDDEENVLKALKRELESVPQYSITAIKSPEIALMKAKSIHYDIVISDYKMPWMHGLTFIKRFMQLQPDATAIVITGDAKGALRHSKFNDAEIPFLLQKPWQQSELLDMIKQALEQKLEHHARSSLSKNY